MGIYMNGQLGVVEREEQRYKNREKEAQVDEKIEQGLARFLFCVFLSM